jgi:XTP/dITP diphosphohydrolase
VEKNVSQRILLATNNRHKISEIQAILGPDWQVIGVSDVAPGLTWDETGESFLENARIKIGALRPYFNGSILADDSGLCVDALQGRPGVHSSSYGGIEGDHRRNLNKLLNDMAAIPSDRRGAHFYCLLLLAFSDGRERCFEGRCNGRISLSPSGSGGFGYDPIFIPNGFEVSMAELTDDQKNSISHRGKAVRAFKDQVSY